jgi:hypothetical protein
LYNFPFLKQLQQSHHLWNAINTLDHDNTLALDLHQLIALTFILEECIKLEVQRIKLSQEQSSCALDDTTDNVIATTLNFYSQPKVNPAYTKKSFPSFTTQIFSPTRKPNLNPKSKNVFSALLADCPPEEYEIEIDSLTNDDDNSTSANTAALKTVSWKADIDITSLSKDLSSQLKDYQEKAAYAGEAEAEFPDCKQPKDLISTNTKLYQRIRFNLIRHRGTVSGIPSIKLFKPFTSTLKKLILPS